MTTLEVRDVSVERSGRMILSQSSITTQTGELVALVGPNGSGKSTLLRVMAGVWQANAGSVLLGGQTLSSKSRHEVARRIALVPQDTHVDFDFTVGEIVSMGRYPHRRRFEAETAVDRKAVQAAARHCDIVDLLDRSISTLSGGERQRALIARSLAVQPEFILLDEPTASLDIEHTLEVMELSQSLVSAGHSVILATHDLNLAFRYATRIALLHSGRIVSNGPPNEVLMTDSLDKTFNVHAERIKTGTDSYIFNFFSDRKNSRFN